MKKEINLTLWVVADSAIYSQSRVFGMVAEVEMSPMSRSTMRQRSRSVPTVDAACWVTLSRVRPAGLHT